MAHTSHIEFHGRRVWPEETAGAVFAQARGRRTRYRICEQRTRQILSDTATQRGLRCSDIRRGQCERAARSCARTRSGDRTGRNEIMSQEDAARAAFFSHEDDFTGIDSGEPDWTIYADCLSCGWHARGEYGEDDEAVRFRVDMHCEQTGHLVTWRDAEQDFYGREPVTIGGKQA